MNLSLYQLTDQYRLALSAIPDNASEEEVHRILDKFDAPITVKVQNTTAYCLNLAAEADAIERVVSKLQGRAAKLKRKEEWYRKYLYVNMKALSITEIKANDGTFKAKIVKNPPKLNITGPVPAEYERVIPEQREPDKVKIKDDLKLGVIIENCALVQGDRLKLE